MKRRAMPALAIAFWLTGSMGFAQSTGESKAPVFDPAKSGVKVIFAPQKAQVPAPSPVAGQRAYVDQQGKIKPADPEDSQKLNDEIKAMFSRSLATLIPLSGPAGSAGMALGEEFMVAATAAIGPDGKIQLQCGPAGQTPHNPERTTPGSKSAGKGGLDVR